MEVKDLEKSIEDLPKHGFDPLDILSPPARLIGIGLLLAAIIVYVVSYG